MHPLYIPWDILDICKKNNIKTQGYSSLGEGSLVDTTNSDYNMLDSIAAKYSCSRAQLLLKWSLQNNVGVIPKSRSIRRLQENYNILFFNISTEDMERMNTLTTSGVLTPKKFCWDP
ncbi:hypothetical protein HDU99_003244, partial [Rhizoclosmatium hyalinum]